MKQTQKTLVASITALLLCGTSTATNADWWEDISLAGFANTTYRHTNEKVQWLPNISEPGVMGAPATMPKYNNGIDKDALFTASYGFNVNARVNDMVTLTSQFLAHQNEDNYALKLDWAVATFQLSDEVALRTGKIKFPIGIVNEYVDIKYALPWIEAPAVIYSEKAYASQSTRESYTGASLLFNVEMGDWYYDTDLFTGQVRLDESTLKNTAGITARANWNETVLFQASHYRGTMTPDLSNPMYAMMIGGEHQATLLSIKADWNNVLFFYENATVNMDLNPNSLSEDLMNTDSWYTTLGYQMGDFLPHYTYQNLKQGDGDENKVSTIGLRWDAMSSVAIKFEVSRISTTVGNKGILLGGLYGVESDAAVGVPGGNLIKPANDVTMFGLSVDMIF